MRAIRQNSAGEVIYEMDMETGLILSGPQATRSGTVTLVRSRFARIAFSPPFRKQPRVTVTGRDITGNVVSANTLNVTREGFTLRTEHIMSATFDWIAAEPH